MRSLIRILPGPYISATHLFICFFVTDVVRKNVSAKSNYLNHVGSPRRLTWVEVFAFGQFSECQRIINSVGCLTNRILWMHNYVIACLVSWIKDFNSEFHYNNSNNKRAITVLNGSSWLLNKCFIH